MVSIPATLSTINPTINPTIGATMQAIETKYIGPTNYRGSRIKARASAGSITIQWDHGLNSAQNHVAAARALAAKFSWEGRWIGGCNAHENGSVFVNTAWVDRADEEFTIECQD